MVLAAGTRLKSAPSVVASLLWLGGFDLTRVPAAKNGQLIWGTGECGDAAGVCGLAGCPLGEISPCLAGHHHAYPCLNTLTTVLRLG